MLSITGVIAALDEELERSGLYSLDEITDQINTKVLGKPATSVLRLFLIKLYL
jgi:hypothetical protein